MVELSTKRNNANEHDTPDGSDNSRNYEQTSDDERYILSRLLHSVVRRELLVQVSTLRHTQSTAGKCKTHAVTSVAMGIHARTKARNRLWNQFFFSNYMRPNELCTIVV